MQIWVSSCSSEARLELCRISQLGWLGRFDDTLPGHMLYILMIVNHRNASLADRGVRYPSAVLSVGVGGAGCEI